MGLVSDHRVREPRRAPDSIEGKDLLFESIHTVCSTAQIAGGELGGASIFWWPTDGRRSLRHVESNPLDPVGVIYSGGRRSGPANVLGGVDRADLVKPLGLVDDLAPLIHVVVRVVCDGGPPRFFVSQCSSHEAYVI